LACSAELARPNVARSLLTLATSVVPFVAIWFWMYETLSSSYLVVLLVAVPAAGFMVRTFIVFHDCAHGSFLPWRRANDWLGCALGLLMFTPFARWRRDHAKHHASAGDLDRRGSGDVPTWTVAEYDACSRRTHFWYRLSRNPFVMFGLGGIYTLIIQPRWAKRSQPARVRRSTWRTDTALALLIGGLCWLVGWRAFLLVEAPIFLITGVVGVWLFLVQHQFDDTYWRRSDAWSNQDAALRGSSYLRLPKVLQFFTGNIGLHHVHHLYPKIPNYHLQRAHDTDPIYADVPHLSLQRALRSIRFKLWDEDATRLVTWADLRHRTAPARPS
jgi:acyl-lipid omega-6 desaturase (Delta-12 desaturase)